MKLESKITSHRELVRRFKESVRGEAGSWRDHKFRAIREHHLAPLETENERFERDLTSAAAAIRSATRRLEESG